MSGPSRAGPPRVGQWPPPRRAGEYSVARPVGDLGSSERSQTRSPEPPPAPEPYLSPAETSAVQAIAEELAVRFASRLEKAAIAKSPDPELSAALTLSTRAVKRWKAIAGAVLAIAGVLGFGAGSRAPEVVGAESRLDSLENRMARIERKLDAALPADPRDGPARD